MLDRPDIDALLVGALYGELSSSDEAILTAHLESHPADRTALDDLKSVRAKLQTSRIFELQLEPPQAVSALLLQEAARRAPKTERAQEREESWFKRFVTTFVAHPAMAAAATLVLVVGVAGTLYLKGDRPVAEQTIAQQEAVTRLPAPTATPVAPMESANGAMAAGSGAAIGGDKSDAVAVKLADEDEGGQRDRAKNFKADSKKGEAPAAPATHASHDLAFGNLDSPQRELKPQPPANPKPDVSPPRKQYVEVGRADHEPKDLERADDTTATGANVVATDGDAPPRQAGPGNGAPAGAPATVTKSKEMPPPPPPPVMAAAAPAADPAPQPAAKKSPPNKASTELAWAQSEHKHVVALVKDGKCQEAAPFAIAIKNRAPDYYATNVATDRALKPCMPYITDTSERSEKAASKRATDTK